MTKEGRILEFRNNQPGAALFPLAFSIRSPFDI